MKNLQNDGQTLKQWLRTNGYDVSWLAEKLGITTQSVYEQLRKEKIGDIFKAKLVRANLTVFTANDNNAANSPVKSIQFNKLNLMIVPLKAYGGFLTGYANRVFLDSLEYSEFPFIKGQCYAFEVDGFSMYNPGDENSVKPSDYVVCTEIPGPDWLNKGKIYVFQTIDGIIIKEFKAIEDGNFILRSLNPDYKDVPPIPVKSVKKIYYKEYIIKK